METVLRQLFVLTVLTSSAALDSIARNTTCMLGKSIANKTESHCQGSKPCLSHGDESDLFRLCVVRELTACLDGTLQKSSQNGSFEFCPNNSSNNCLEGDLSLRENETDPVEFCSQDVELYCLNGAMRIVSVTNETRCSLAEPVTCQNTSKLPELTTDDCKGTDEKVKSTASSARADYVGYVVVPLFLVLGVVGNCLSIRIMLSEKFRTRTSSIILIALAVSDTIFSFIVPFNKKFVREWLGYDPRALTAAGCSAFFVIHKTSKMSSSWFVVFISFERFIAICFPLKAKFICTKKNALIGIACVYLGMLIFNGIWDFNTAIVNGLCIPNLPTPWNPALGTVYLIVGTCAYSIIPVSIMMVLTTATVVQLIRHFQLRRVMAKSDTSHDDVNRMTAMLIGVTIAFVILVTPISIAHNVSFALGENIFETNYSGMMIAREILQIMEQLNYSINFLLYVMCSRDFRQKLKELFHCGSGLGLFRKSVTKSTNLSKERNKETF